MIRQFLVLAFLVLSLAAAASAQQPDDSGGFPLPTLLAPQLAEEAPVNLLLPEPEPPPRGRQAEIRQAVESYLHSGEAAVIKRTDSVVFPFDEAQPVVRCSPLRACDIELQPSEIVTGVALGDTERWVTSPLLSGDVDRPVRHVIVKPKDYDLATNLVIGTTRRTYHLGLISPKKTEVEKGDVAYHRHVSFYYPEDLVETWASQEQLERDRRQRRDAITAGHLAAGSVAQLNFDYEVDADRAVTWAPTTVFDDGQHVYIRLPPSVRATDLPALLIEAEGQHSAANYRVDDPWPIVDGLFRRAELVVGVGKRQRKVEITSRRHGG